MAVVGDDAPGKGTEANNSGVWLGPGLGPWTLYGSYLAGPGCISLLLFLVFFSFFFDNGILERRKGTRSFGGVGENGNRMIFETRCDSILIRPRLIRRRWP